MNGNNNDVEMNKQNEEVKDTEDHNEDEGSIDINFDSNDEEDDSTEEYLFWSRNKTNRTLHAQDETQVKKNYHPQYYKIHDRIKLLRQ
jgi:hypothetical protein